MDTATKVTPVRGDSGRGRAVEHPVKLPPLTAGAVATAFRIVAVAEALSWLGLLAGMFVKYVPETSEVGVQVFGPIHGGIFMAYVVLTLVASRVLRWPARTTLLALVASVPPLATVWFERRATRNGQLLSREAVAA
jgi:integral membrane protein